MRRLGTSSWQLSLVFTAFVLFTLTNAHVFTAHQRPGVSRWIRGARVDGNRRISMHISIAASKSIIANAAQHLYRTSDPASVDYGKHWSAARVASHFAPTSDTIQEIVAWLNQSGIPRSSLRVSQDRNHIFLAPKVRDAELLLNAHYHEFHDQTRSGHEPQLAVEEYSIPDSVIDSINFIEPTWPTDLRRTKPTRSKKGVAANNGTNVDCLKYMTPECLRLLYHIPHDHMEPHPNNSFGIYEISWVTWLPNDLDLFFSRFEPQLVGSRPVVLPVNGGYMQSNYTGFAFNAEPAVDFEYAMALTHPQPVINIQVGDYFTPGDLNNMLAALDASDCDALDPQFDHTYPNASHTGGYNKTTDCGVAAPPSVISISYVSNEADFPPGYLEQQCLEFLKLGLQGVSVVAATGDWGVADQLSQCLDPSTGHPGIGNGTSHFDFSSAFPASCPWVTAVGGTSLAPLTNGTPAAWNQSTHSFPPQQAYRVAGDNTSTGRGASTSGGGFSRVFSTPEYQTKDISLYLAAQQNHTAPFATHFNAGGRGYPDVALLASNYLVVYAGGLYTIDGTSASTPVFAAMLARINNERLREGKGTVGFVNPVLYRHEEIFEDVKEGSNGGCGVEEAFRAAEGWDAVTGLGAPDFERMRGVFMGLP